jgi:predicted nucleic acid-binding protein
VDLIADTTFLVGLWRGQPWAQSFARTNPSQSIGLPWVVLGEFWHGATRAGHDPIQVREFLALGLPLLDAGPVIPVYARMCAGLQDSPVYLSISQNDLWIAASSLAFDRPLITRNRRHFDQIAGLRFEVLTE